MLHQPRIPPTRAGPRGCRRCLRGRGHEPGLHRRRGVRRRGQRRRWRRLQGRRRRRGRRCRCELHPRPHCPRGDRRRHHERPLAARRSRDGAGHGTLARADGRRADAAEAVHGRAIQRPLLRGQLRTGEPHPRRHAPGPARGHGGGAAGVSARSGGHGRDARVVHLPPPHPPQVGSEVLSAGVTACVRLSDLALGQVRAD